MPGSGLWRHPQTGIEQIDAFFYEMSVAESHGDPWKAAQI